MTLDAWSCLQGICGQIGQAGEMRFVHHGQSSNSSSFFFKWRSGLPSPAHSLAHWGLPHDTFTLSLQRIICSRVILYDLDVQSLYILICIIKYGLNWIELNPLCCMYIPKTDKTTCKDMCNDQYIMHFKRRHHSITVLYIL